MHFSIYITPKGILPRPHICDAHDLWTTNSDGTEVRSLNLTSSSATICFSFLRCCVLQISIPLQSSRIRFLTLRTIIRVRAVDAWCRRRHETFFLVCLLVKWGKIVISQMWISRHKNQWFLCLIFVFFSLTQPKKHNGSGTCLFFCLWHKAGTL